MSVCPTCGHKSEPQTVASPDQLLDLLRIEKAEVYKSVSGTWHVTRHRGTVPKAYVDDLLERGLIRPSYTTSKDCFTTERTLDCDATMRARREKRDRRIMIYI